MKSQLSCLLSTFGKVDKNSVPVQNRMASFVPVLNYEGAERRIVWPQGCQYRVTRGAERIIIWPQRCHSRVTRGAERRILRPQKVLVQSSEGGRVTRGAE